MIVIRHQPYLYDPAFRSLPDSLSHLPEKWQDVICAIRNRTPKRSTFLAGFEETLYLPAFAPSFISPELLITGGVFHPCSGHRNKSIRKVYERSAVYGTIVAKTILRNVSTWYQPCLTLFFRSCPPFQEGPLHRKNIPYT